ncbi:hypothetical protein INR49_008248 [Caranx melampygus]|nr:hypothetical protein INR49_008248 [Caranx melampygus]
MDPVQPLLEQFRPRSEAEASWLRDMFTFIRQQVCPVFTGPAPLAAEEALTGGGVCSDVCVSLTVCVVKTLQENMTTVSVSELLSQQHLACVSHLSWSTNQQRAWAREAELCLPGSKALPRVNLLLIGCLRKERGGEWRLTDSSGSVRCECLSPSPQWLGRPVLLPHWNYIPHDASGQDEAGGWVELIGSPVLLCPSAEQGLAAERGVEPNRPMGVREAAGVLNNRVRGQRLSVCGQVSSVLPLLDISGTTFFCFTLTEDRLRLPVLVKGHQLQQSGGAPPTSTCPCDGALPRLLVEKNMSVSEYLWTCHLSSQLSHSLVPSVLRQQQCVCVLSWKLMELVWRRGGRGGRRSIYSEMLDEPHTCPLTQYSVDPAVPQLLSVSELIVSLQVDSWSSVSLRSLLPPDGPSLSRSVINTALSWSYRTLTSDPQSSPKSGETARRRPLLLVGLLELPPPTSETHTLCSSETGRRLSPVSSRKPVRRKEVEQKEGVAWRNTGEGSGGGGGLVLHFSVRAAVIGPVVCWGRDPKNEPMSDRETEGEEQKEVVLVFSGVCARWFPLLQSRCFYRLVAHSQDPSVLIGCGVSGRKGVELHTDSTLQVQSDWRFHILTRPPALQALSPTVLSVSQVLDCSSELVCFQAVVSDRISLNNRTTESAQTHTGVRLTMSDQSGRSLQVYLDLSHTPYPPGLLPGNTLLLSAFQRRVSSSARPPPPPMMHLGLWAVGREGGGCTVGQSCSSSQCRSTSSVFHSKAKLVIDDGTGEAHVWVSGALVRPLLRLADCQWAGLQRAVRVKGHIRVYPQGRSLVCDGGNSDDSLLHFLLCVCSSDVCGPLSLTCRRHSKQRPEEMRRFSRGDRDFMSRTTPPLQLTCLHLDDHPLT